MAPSGGAPSPRRYGQGTTKIRQGSSQAEEGKGEDHRGQPIAEGGARTSRSGASEEQLIAMGGAVRIFIDADACPVKEEFTASPSAARCRSRWSATRIRLPDHPLIGRVLVSDAFDAADDWIAGEADARTVVITSDILLADRCLKAGATVIGNNGKPFTSASIGSAIATRAIAWPTCERAATWRAAPRRSPRRTGRGSAGAG